MRASQFKRIPKQICTLFHNRTINASVTKNVSLTQDKNPLNSLELIQTLEN